ncbi:hypothetical protein GGR54DRAFT_636290 [Hypoxylon sp. NC1633]|nr:hypothetical protein GGR54DRAFT_636290 [Hypoxylon sp. NC1633]
MADDPGPDPIAKPPRPVSKWDKIIESPDDSRGPLTFGIELEFLVPFIKKGEEDPHPKEERPPFRCSFVEFDRQILDVIEPFSHIRFRSQLKDLYHPPHNNVVRYDSWRLVKDASVKYVGPKFEYLWAGREVTSDVMRSDDPVWYVKRITDVCRAIRETRVHLNRTTSVHVHVGRGDESFSLLTMKKFATLIFYVDEMLLKLHHPWRQKSSHCRLIALTSRLGKKTMKELMEGGDPLDSAQAGQMDEFVPIAPDVMRTQQATKSIEDLAYLMCDPILNGFVRGSVAFRRFMPAGSSGGNTHTFEFRQMAGCLEPGPIIHWVRVCLALVDYARLSEPPKYKALLWKVLNGEVDASALLLELNLVEEEKYFRTSVEGYANSVAFFTGQDEAMEKNNKGSTFPRVVQNIRLHTEISIEIIDKRLKFLRQKRNADWEQIERLHRLKWHLEEDGIGASEDGGAVVDDRSEWSQYMAVAGDSEEFQAPSRSRLPNKKEHQRSHMPMPPWLRL